jgi:hypothetical protein
MIFKVERLGPVERAEIDLSKDLILLTGPNGTGKTYVAWATYGFLSGLEEGHFFLALVRTSIAPTVDRLLSTGTSVLDLAAAEREHGASILAAATRRYAALLADDFAADRRIFEHSVLRADAGAGGWWTNPHDDKMSSSQAGWHFLCRWEPSSSGLHIEAARREPQDGGVKTFQSLASGFIPLEQLAEAERSSIQGVLAHVIATWIVTESTRPCRIFPAERIATTIFWRELSLKRAELVDQVLAMQEQPERAVEHVRREAQRYPRPIRDSLQMAGDLDRWNRNRSEFADLADYVEDHLLRGKVRLSAYGELEFVPSQRPDMPLGVHVTASMVKSLSLLVFYLRHMAERGDMVIIDEPELNLHPDNQRLIARVLARAVNRGLKIMASTHSDYLIRELNNLIMLGQDTEAMRALRGKHGYEEAELLKPEQLGVYLFQNNTAEAVPVDETGFAVATIDDEINKLNAVSQEIYAALLEQES